MSTAKWSVALAGLALALALRRLLRTPRTTTVPPAAERVVILGASSGIGRALAHRYASRGARVCLVARRAALLAAVADECAARGARAVLALPADFADAPALARARAAVAAAWGGLDTLVVAAGVSALRPVLELAGAEGAGDAPPAGVARALAAAAAAMHANFTGPLVAALTFIPALQRTSRAPAVLLLGSLAAAVPAPTRALYAASKAAALALYQALAQEHARVAFALVLPSTVEGAFRAGAVDGGPVREAAPQVHGLKREAVAARCVRAVDGGGGVVFVPGWMRAAHFLYWAWPPAIEYFARRKYNYTA